MLDYAELKPGWYWAKDKVGLRPVEVYKENEPLGLHVLERDGGYPVEDYKFLERIPKPKEG